MPRLQLSRRSSLLYTSVRNAFLKAFTRRTVQEEVRESSPAGFSDLARRVQADIQRETGRYFPLHQVVLSMHDLKREPEPVQSLRELSRDVPLIEVTSPQLNSSMSRRRLERNIPVLQCQLVIPPPYYSNSLALSPTSESRLTPTSTFFSNMSRRNSGARSHSPITPIDQILHTPPTPPRLPRFAPPAARTWARLNVQARNGESSPLESPGLALTPYMLNATNTGKPSLTPLQIPSSVVSSDWVLRDNHFMPPSPLALSPFDLPKCPFPGGALQAAARPAAPRTNSASTLARTALLRVAHPSFGRRGSFNERSTDGRQVGDLERAASPLSPFAATPMSNQALASPFAIHPEAMGGSYFYRA